jgi:hypothetical protein
VGVAGDGKYLMLNEAPRSYFYLPLAQNYRSPITLMVRSTSDPAALAKPLQDLLREMDADLPVFNVRTMERHIRDSVFGLMPLRMAAAMAGVEGLLGLFLAIMGLYAVVSYSANQPVHEIGVRMALATRRSRPAKQGHELTSSVSLSPAIVVYLLPRPLRPPARGPPRWSPSGDAGGGSGSSLLPPRAGPPGRSMVALRCESLETEHEPLVEVQGRHAADPVPRRAPTSPGRRSPAATSRR